MSRKKQAPSGDRVFVDALQFEKVLYRQLAEGYRDTAEYKLICAIFMQAWKDGDFQSAQFWFIDDNSSMQFYCGLIGLNHLMVREWFTKLNRPYFNSQNGVDRIPKFITKVLIEKANEIVAAESSAPEEIEWANAVLEKSEKDKKAKKLARKILDKMEQL